MDRLTTLIAALGVTIAVEFVVVLLIQRQDWRWLFITSMLVNALSEPLANVVYQRAGRGFWALEAAVVLIEGPLLWALLRVSWPRAYLLSVAANATSALIGLLIFS
jgi:hypothetical protein